MEKDKLLRFIQADDVEVEQLPWGPHAWIARPGLVDADNLLLVRVAMPPGKAHQFHRHPEMEEIIYVLSGTAEQWVEEKCCRLGPGEAAHIPTNIVHGTYNTSADPLEFLAILSPAKFDGPALIDVCHEKPWSDLKEPVEYSA